MKTSPGLFKFIHFSTYIILQRRKAWRFIGIFTNLLYKNKFCLTWWSYEEHILVINSSVILYFTIFTSWGRTWHFNWQRFSSGNSYLWINNNLKTSFYQYIERLSQTFSRSFILCHKSVIIMRNDNQQTTKQPKYVLYWRDFEFDQVILRKCFKIVKLKYFSF